MEPVLQTLSELIAINSINPAHEGGVPEEGVAQYVEAFFAARGIETFRQPVLPGRDNVIARVPGQDSSRRLILEAHMDTVSVSGMTIPPFVPEIRDGLLYGRGSCDTKAGLATMMHALAHWKEDGRVPPCELWLAATVDEEVGFRGVTKLCEGLSATAAIVAEPTRMRIVVAAKGVLRWKIRTRGVAVHSSQPHLGVSAIRAMVPVLDWLEADHQALASVRHPLLGPATISVGTIRGGEQTNFIPEVCEITLDRRLLPGEDALTVWKSYEAALAGIPGINAIADPPWLADPAMETTPESHLVRTAQEVLGGLGYDAVPCGVPFGSDASKLVRQGIPSIIFGPGNIDQAHTAAEYVPCAEVSAALAFHLEFIRRF
ncbi:MAG: M20/M25/M40 family metallo-hydrolase [Bryobacteraceae bacterium]|nr:M20/M25/M40 family metallo-hydrolase [Bryobacteraceae bacterium]